jgi:anti-anti-sigma factor
MTVDVDDGADGVRVLRARGEVDLLTVDQLPDLSELVRPGTPLVLDLAAVTFLDSAGVRLVHRLAEACGRNRDAFCVVAPPGGRARRALDLMGLAEPHAEDDLTAALRRVARD